MSQGGAGDTLSFEAMAREAATRGRNVFNGFYAARTGPEKKRLREMKSELEALMVAS
jgi:hypothetical protein